MRTAERGFTLLEVLVCTGLLTIAAAATFGAFAALARNATPGTSRDVALMIAENVLARARAAAAYASSPVQDGPTLLADRSWALRLGETTFAAGAQLRANATCNVAEPKHVRLPVTASFEGASQRFSVAVTYPRDVCRVAPDGTIPSDDTATLTLAETLPPPAYPPGQVIHRDVPPPARM